MKRLAPAERVQLRFFMMFRDRPLTVWSLFRLNRLYYGFILAVMVVVCSSFLLLDTPWGAGVFAAFCFGATIRDCAFFRRSAFMWPHTREVLDWARIEQMLTDDRAAAEGRQAGNERQ